MFGHRGPKSQNIMEVLIDPQSMRLIPDKTAAC